MVYVETGSLFLDTKVVLTLRFRKEVQVYLWLIDILKCAYYILLPMANYINIRNIYRYISSQLLRLGLFYFRRQMRFPVLLRHENIESRSNLLECY